MAPAFDRALAALILTKAVQKMPPEHSALARRAYSYRDNREVPSWDDQFGLVVFDGTCVFCSRFVQFVLKYDGTSRFLFTTAQSELGDALYRHYGLATDTYTTSIVIVNGLAYFKSAAFFAVAKELNKPWPAIGIFRAIPRPFSDWCYDRIASNRYAIFGRYDSCRLPSVAEKQRFIL